MSTHKPNQQQKISLEARVFEILNRVSPEFKCSITDIKYPKSEFVIKVYTFILEELRFNVPKLMMGPLENQLAGEANPELYQRNMPLYNLSRALGTLFDRLLGADKLQFGLEDLLEPSVSRNSIFLFNLLNFLSFADARVHELAVKVEVIGEYKRDVNKILEKREMLSREINQRALTKGKRADYAKEIKVKKAEIEEMQKESKSVEQLSEKKLAELEVARAKLSRVESDVSQLNEAYHKLEAQQVQSPDVFKNDFKKMQVKLEETKQQLAQAQQTLKERKETIALFEKVVKGQDSRFGLVTDIVSESKSLKDLEKQFAEVQRKQKSEMEETSNWQASLQDLMRQSADISHQLTTLQLQVETKKRSMAEEIRFLEEEKCRLSEKMSQEEEKVHQALCSKQAEYNELIEENLNFNKMCEKLYAELMEKERDFVTRSHAEIEMYSAGIEKLKRTSAKF